MLRYLLVVLIILAGCHPQRREADHQQQQSNEQFSLDYAEGFRITYQGDIKLLEVLYPYQGADKGYKYLLVPRHAAVPSHDAETRIIRIPVRSIVCTSTTHIPLLDYIDETNKLTGFPTTDFISSPRMRAHIDKGLVTELGVDKGINMEKLVALQPDMVMGYSMNSDYGQFKKMEEMGIPVVINAEYLEKHPLGRAEWIKFMAAFFNKEQQADSVFNVIKTNYLQTQSLVKKDKDRVSVMSGIVYGDAWFLPGGKNYAAQLFKDAGMHYLWKDDPSQGFLELSVESVFEKAHRADLWIGVGTFNTLEEMKHADDRYAGFKAYQEKQVYTYDARKGPKGGSEFLELGYLRPDIILKDLVKLSDSTLLKDYKLYFHRRLQ